MRPAVMAGPAWMRAAVVTEPDVTRGNTP
jgi:hypothetical protein